MVGLFFIRYYLFRNDNGFSAVPMGRGMRKLFSSRRTTTATSSIPTKEKIQ